MARLGEMEKDCLWDDDLVSRFVFRQLLINDRNPTPEWEKDPTRETLNVLMGNYHARFTKDETKMVSCFQQVRRSCLVTEVWDILRKYYQDEKKMIPWYIRGFKLQVMLSSDNLTLCFAKLSDEEFLPWIEELTSNQTWLHEISLPWFRRGSGIGSGACAYFCSRSAVCSRSEQNRYFQLALERNYGKAYLHLGNLHAEADRIEESQACYLRAVELNDEDALNKALTHYQIYPSLEGFFYCLKHKKDMPAYWIYRNAMYIHPHYLLLLNIPKIDDHIQKLYKDKQVNFTMQLLTKPHTYFSAYCVPDIQREISKYLAY